jgi:hypothetical protein
MLALSGCATTRNLVVRPLPEGAERLADALRQAVGSGEAAALVSAGAAMLTQRARVAMRASMTKEDLVFMFLSVLLLADKPTGTA